MVRKLFYLLAAAAAILTSCQAEKLDIDAGGSLCVKMVAVAEETRTSIESDYSVTWGKGEYVTMYYNDGTCHLADSDGSSADAYDGKSEATFSFTISPAPKGSCRIGGIYPSSAVGKNPSGSTVEVNIPSVQNATASSYDPAAFIMVIKPETVSEIPTSWTAWFRKAAALNKLTLKGIGAPVSKVVISSPSSDLCGDGVIDLDSGQTTGYRNTENSISVLYASPLPKGDATVWFTSWNASVQQGEELTVTAYSADGYYTKTITAREGGIAFIEGKLNFLTVDFSSVKLTPYSLRDFAEAFVTCLDVWENTIGKVDADGTHNGSSAWSDVHLLPIINTSAGRYKNAGNQYDEKYAPFWKADLGGKSYSSNQCWEIAIRGLMNLCTAEGDAFLPGMTDRNKAYTLTDGGTLDDPVPSYLPNNQWGDYPWYEFDKEVKNNGVAVTEVGVDFLIKCGSWHIVRGLINNSGNSALGKIGNYQEFGTKSSTLILDKYVGYISPMRELLIAARIYKYLLDNDIRSNAYTALKGVKFDYGLYSSNAAPEPVQSGNKAALWVNYSSMNGVNLQVLADKGISDLLLHEYAFSKLGKNSVDEFIARAHSYGIKVHIWMQCFWWNDATKWRVPVIDRKGSVPASYNQPLFDEIIARATGYLDSNIDGLHLDYVRFGGTAGSHNWPEDDVTAVGAITEFCRQFSVAAKARKSKIILSAALMGETGLESSYGQKPSKMGQYLDILMPMAYIASYGYSDTQNVNVANWFKSNSGGAQVWHAIATYNAKETGLDSDSIYHDCANIINNSNADGIALFRYGIGTIPYLNGLFNN